jgi:hypothetical protein
VQYYCSGCAHTCEDKRDDVKDSFYQELGHVSDHFPRYNMIILLGDFNAKVGREKNLQTNNRKREFT